MRGNMKLRSQFRLFGVDYMGHMELKSTMQDREVIIDLKGERRIYVTAKFLNDFSKMLLVGKCFHNINKFLSCFLQTFTLKTI